VAVEQPTIEQPEVRGKVVQVFRFLESLNQLRNPVQTAIGSQPWSFWLRDLPEHACINRGWGDDAEAADGALLKIRRPNKTEPPEPPRGYAEWVDDDWENPFSVLTIKSYMIVRDQQGSDNRTTLGGDAHGQLRQWLASWGSWAELEKPVFRVMTVFEEIYRLHSRLDRKGERYELLVGDGVLHWQPKSANLRIQHPVLLQRVQLNFDPEVPEFIFEIVTGLRSCILGCFGLCRR
jgi:hypothetical protein